MDKKARSDPTPGVKMVINPKSNIGLKGSNQQDWNKESVAIRAAVEKKAGDIGMCGGIITSSYLDVDQVNESDIILTVWGAGDPRTRSDSPETKLGGFALCRVIKNASYGGKKFLYVDIICAKDPLRKGYASALWNQIICYLLPILPDVEGVQLSSLTYVVGYYYNQLGFRFYTKPGLGKKEMTLDSAANAAAKEFSKYVFDSADEYDVLEGKKPWETWNDYAKWLVESNKGLEIPKKLGKQLMALLSRLAKKERVVLDDEIDAETHEQVYPRQEHPEEYVDSKRGKQRRDTLPARLEIVREIMPILKSASIAVETGSPVLKFMTAASEHGVEAPLFRKARLKKRVVGEFKDMTEEEKSELVEELELGSLGWTMFLLKKDIMDAGCCGADVSHMRKCLKSLHVGSLDTKGGGSIRKRTRRRRRRKKRTRKRALRKRHRRRTGRKRRRRRTRRR